MVNQAQDGGGCKLLADRTDVKGVRGAQCALTIDADIPKCVLIDHLASAGDQNAAIANSRGMALREVVAE